MGKMTNEQKNRFAIAEKVITRDALASGLTLEDLISVADYVERGAVWRKPAKKKRRRGDLAASPVRDLSPAGWEAALKNAAKAGRSQQETEEHMNECSLCRELAEADARGELSTMEEVAAATDTPLLEVRGNLDSTEAGESFSPVGEDPGDREVLTQWAEVIRQQDAAREAAREARDLEVDPEDEEGEKPEEERFATSRAVTWAPQRHAPETSEKAPDHVVAQGASLGCPECSAEAERREKRDEALERGRIKLGNRLPAGEFARTGPLDEDELLAVAGSEVYPPNDEEPSLELKIRNRKGEVFVHDRDGWTAMPGNPWAIHYAWTSLEMSRRGPWHVV